MSRKRRKSVNKKPIIAVFLIVALIVGVGAAFYVIANPPPRVVASGLRVGDTFTFEIKGTSDEADINLVNSIVEYDFGHFNATENYKITVTGVNGTQVSLDTVWRFKNGTEITKEQTIDLATGIKTDEDGFYAVYAANLTINEKLRPNGNDTTTINATESKTYTGGARQTNILSLQNQFFDPDDPTGSTLLNDLIYIYFDKPTGMLVDLSNIQFYNNPEMTLTITWKLKETNVWAVS